MSFESSHFIGPLRITIVSHIFHPDELGGAALMTDLARFLKESGHEVNVVSTFPYYPRWKLAPEDQGVWRREDLVDSIPVRRVRMYVPRQLSTLNRLLSDLSFLLSLTFLGRSGWKNADVIVTTCPMFGQTTAMRFATPFRRVPKLVIVQDFVVDAALELGMIKVGWFGGMLKALERWAFRSCATLTTISEEMLKKLNQIVGPGRRTLLVPNWIHGSLAAAIERRRQHTGGRAAGRLFYSGNVGRKQGLPDFLGMFSGNEANWKLRINGTGAEFEELKTACASLPHVELYGLQDESKYIDSLLGCSACLVTQKPGVGANFLPSKILPALATGTPILAVCEKHSPLGREVIESGCGVVVQPGDGPGLAKTLRAWRDSPALLQRYSANASARAKRYERGYVLNQYQKEIFRLAGQPSARSREHEAAASPTAAAAQAGPLNLVNCSLPPTAKSFLLIGGTGFIGRNLARLLLKRFPGCQVVLADLQPLFSSATVPGARFVRCDARAELEPQLGRDRFDCIYSLAAVHREPGHAPEEYFETNVNAAGHVCDYAELVGCSQLVFFSSIAVYGPAHRGTTERDDKHPNTPYGKSKLMAEARYEKWWAGGPGRSLRIVRPGVVYGPGETGNMMRMVRAVKRGYFAFPGSLQTRKSIAYIDGLLDSIEFAEALPDPLFVYNYIDKDTLTIAELVGKLSEALNRRTPVIRVPLFLLLPVAHSLQWISRGKSPIHPVRVRKVGTPTWVVPQALIERGFTFKYDFATSLRAWQEQSPEDFQ